MTEFFIVRHGETEWNREGNRYCGRTDISLSDEGVQQAKETADMLKSVRFDMVAASSLRRAVQTAKIIAGPHGQSVVEDDRLIEIDFGQWEGMTRKEIQEKDSGHWERWVVRPESTRAGHDGETALEVLNRAREFYTSCRRDHPGGRVLVVSHNTVNRLFLAGMLKMPLSNYRMLKQDNAAVTVFDFGEGFRIKQLNVFGSLTRNVHKPVEVKPQC